MEAEASNSFRLPSDWNDLIPDEEWADMSEYEKGRIMRIVAKEEESLRRLCSAGVSGNPNNTCSLISSPSDKRSR